MMIYDLEFASVILFRLVHLHSSSLFSNARLSLPIADDRYVCIPSITVMTDKFKPQQRVYIQMS